jgi:molecular chaperone Hsp33
MTMQGDYLLRILAKEEGVRGLFCVTTRLVQEVVERHRKTTEQPWTPTAEAMLGHGLTGVALMGALLKVRQRIAIKLEGDGPLRKLVAESDAYGRVRGWLANPSADLPGSAECHALPDAFGQGQLVVVRDLLMRDLFEGVVSFVPGNLGDNLTDYLTRSEQIPSFVETAVLLDAEGEVVMAGGMLVQALPGEESADAVTRLQQRSAEWPPVAELLRDGHTPHDLAAMLFSGFDYIELEERSLQFQCGCGWERAEKALLMLGQAELTDLLAQGHAHVDCHFCGERYLFERDALETLVERAGGEDQ